MRAMNLFRVLLLGLALYLIWRLIGHSRAGLRREPPGTPEKQFEPMQRCSGCGTYLPASSLSKNGRCGRCSE